MNVNADEVIKDLSQKLANTQVENSILFIEKKHLEKQLPELNKKINELKKRIEQLEKEKK